MSKISMLNSKLICLPVMMFLIGFVNIPVHVNASEATTRELIGKELVDIHCGRCHLAPEPDTFPSEVWPVSLHRMAWYVGMRDKKTLTPLIIEDIVHELIPEQPLRAKSVTYVSGINCYPCVRYGPTLDWRRKRDSNPRYAINVYTLSRPAP